MRRKLEAANGGETEQDDRSDVSDDGMPAGDLTGSGGGDQTQDKALGWPGSGGPAGEMSQEDIEKMRQRFENLSPEEQEKLKEQFKNRPPGQAGRRRRPRGDGNQ